MKFSQIRRCGCPGRGQGTWWPAAMGGVGSLSCAHDHRLFPARVARWGRNSRRSPGGLPTLTGACRLCTAGRAAERPRFRRGRWSLYAEWLALVRCLAVRWGPDGRRQLRGRRWQRSCLRTRRTPDALQREARGAGSAGDGSRAVERLVAKGRVRVTDPDDDEVVEWRRLVDQVKRHGLEPAGKRVEKVPNGGPGRVRVLVRTHRCSALSDSSPPNVVSGHSPRAALPRSTQSGPTTRAGPGVGHHGVLGAAQGGRCDGTVPWCGPCRCDLGAQRFPRPSGQPKAAIPP